MRTDEIANSMFKSILITHIDLDGVAPIILANKYNDYYNEIEMHDYGDFDSKEVQEAFLQKDYQKICLTDYSFPRDFLEEILKNKKVQVEIYDHHESSEWLKELDYPNLKVFHDKERCGTRLYFEEKLKKYYSEHSQIVEDFVNLVDTYDIWRTDSKFWEEALNLNRVYYATRLYNVPDQLKCSIPFISKVILKFENSEKWYWASDEFLKIKKSLEREEQAYRDAKRILKFRTDTKGLRFGLTKMSSKISIVSMRLLKEFPDLDYMIIMNTWTPEKLGISYRSEKVDCTQSYFCNGHVSAAGGTLPSAAFWEDFWLGKINSLPWEDEHVNLETGEIISSSSIRSRKI